MADVQLFAPGVEAAPLDYTLPDTAEILLKAAGAIFDGTAAAGAFLPAIVITPPSGVPLPPFTTDTAVAAGASAEVAWFPGVKVATASTPVTTVGLPWCFMQRNNVAIPNYAGVTTGVDFDLTNGHVSGFSSDAAIFTAGAAVGGGLHGISILAEGQFLWAASAVFVSAAPAAGATAAVRTSWDNGDTWVASYVDTFKTGPGAGVTQAQPSIVEQFNLKAGGTAPPQDSTVFLSQNSGAAITVGQVTLAVFQFSPTGTLDFT
jgi:hypothetical protein